jgi:4-hydroxybenzoate polyprenyltransferase
VPPFLRALRPAQWSKNLFVLAPLVFAHRLDDPQALARAIGAFAAFCAAASAIYLLNDLHDIEEDRRHPRKRLRPLAAGLMRPATALVWSTALAGLAGGAALWLGPAFARFLICYLGLNILYSWRLKHLVILDVMSISLGFVLRVLAGAAAVGVAVSSWILLCTIFLALFLAFSKRRHELVLLASSAANQRRVLDSYSPAFLDQMINVVTASAVVSYALYAVAPETVEKYHSQNLVYTVPMVLYGIFRYLYLIYQTADERNPTEALLHDTPFILNMVIWGLAVAWVVYGA